MIFKDISNAKILQRKTAMTKDFNFLASVLRHHVTNAVFRIKVLHSNQSIVAIHFTFSKLHHILQYIISFFALEYFFGEKNENCPIGRIVPTEEECKKASSQLGIEYKNKLRKVDYPVGCYTKSDHSSYLNTQLDPSTSAPENFENRIGICRTGTTLNLVDPFSDFIT